jgi:hypothetical protein
VALVIPGKGTGGRGSSRGRPPFDAVSYLSVFLVLTFAVPSYLTVSALGSVGRPSTLWGLAGLLWWGLYRVGRQVPQTSGSKAVRLAVLAPVACVLMSYSLASFQGLPPAESSVADSGLLRMAGWAGVALVANDGIDSKERFRTLLERVALTGGLMATLGLAQFWTGESLIDWMSLPGFTAEQDTPGVQNRSGFVRSAGTAMHPLEYGVVLCMALPIAVALALAEKRRSLFARWYPVGAMAFASYLSVSRSALIGVAVGVLVSAFGWPRKVRRGAILILSGGMTVVYFGVPGMAGTIRGLFMGVGSDASTMSRTNSYDLAFSIANRNPLFGRGFLTLLPEYIILDNQFLGILIELGYVGLAVIATMLIVSIRAAAAFGIRSSGLDDTQIGFAVTAALVSGTIMFAFLDGLAFPMSAGMLFLTIGLAGAACSTAQTGAAIT